MVNKSLVQLFKNLDLTSKHAVLYSALLAYPKATPLVLARETRLNRSSTYRYLSDLLKTGLVEEILESHRTSYRALDPENLQLIVAKQEAKLTVLKNSVPAVVRELTAVKKSAPPSSEVVYYHGVDGLRQMLWKMVTCGLNYEGLGYEDWNTSVGKRFAEKLRRINIENGAQSREIQNEDGNYAYTDLATEYFRVYQHRIIARDILEIKHDTYIYGDTFAYFYHYDGELFGVEIHNAEIARTEKQIFEILWRMAQDPKK